MKINRIYIIFLKIPKGSLKKFITLQKARTRYIFGTSPFH